MKVRELSRFCVLNTDYVTISMRFEDCVRAWKCPTVTLKENALIMYCQMIYAGKTRKSIGHVSWLCLIIKENIFKLKLAFAHKIIPCRTMSQSQLKWLITEESKRRKFRRKKTLVLQKFRDVWLHFDGTIHAIQRKNYRGGDFGQRKIYGRNRLFSFPVFPQFWLTAQLLKRVFFE